MKENSTDIESRVIDSMLSIPVPFKIGEDDFYIYHKTLGRIQLLSRLRKLLGINEKFAQTDPYAEALRLCHNKKDIVCRLIAYSTLKTKDEIFNNSVVSGRIKYFEEKLSDEELATIFLSILLDDEIPSFEKYFGITEDYVKRKEVSKVKKYINAITFGGHSIYGLLIDFACQRYGWTLDYLLWEVNYTTLMMLYSDKIESTYLSDEERKQLHIFDDKEYINADDPKNKELIRKMLSE